MNADQAKEFSEAFGMIGAGWWRQVAWAADQGIPKALGLDTRQWVEKYVGGWVRLPTEERVEAVKELAAEGKSGRQIAAVLGVDESTVRRDQGRKRAAKAAPKKPPDADRPVATAGKAAPPSRAAAKKADDQFWDKAEEQLFTPEERAMSCIEPIRTST